MEGLSGRSKTSHVERPETHYIRSGDLYVAYQVVGEGPQALVIVGGGISNLELSWDDPEQSSFYSALARFVRLVLMDRRGVGVSDRTGAVPTLEQQVDDLRAVMDAAGVERACLAGAADAAAVTAMFASTYPARVAGLLLWQPTARGAWAPDYPWGFREPETPWLGSKFASREHVETSVRRNWPSKSGDREFEELFMRFMRLSASPSSYAAFYRMWFDIDVRHLLDAIQAPTLVMHGSEKATSGKVEESRYIAERIPGARLIEFPEVEWTLFSGQQERIVTLTRDFVDEVWEQATATRDRVLATVLFTDLVGSTGQAVALGPRWQEVMREHNAVIRRELARFHGREIDTAGDGFFASGFDGPARAIRCGCAIRDAMAALDLRIRVGVHTGECDVVDGKLAGIAVAIGARIAAQASEGEVLVSGTVRDLVAGSGIAFEPRGMRELKGVGEWPLYSIVNI